MLEFKLCIQTFSWYRSYGRSIRLTAVSYTFIFALSSCNLSSHKKTQGILESQNDTGRKGHQEVSAQSRLSQKGQVVQGVIQQGASKDGDCTTSLGNLFQRSAVLLMKNISCFCIFRSAQPFSLLSRKVTCLNSNESQIPLINPQFLERALSHVYKLISQICSS